MKQFIYGRGRCSGKNLAFHLWFIEMIPTLKKGWTMAILTGDGLAIFEFKGIKKSKSPKITFESAEAL